MDKQEKLDKLDKLIAKSVDEPIIKPVNEGDGADEEYDLLVERLRNEHDRNENWHSFFYRHIKWIFSVLVIVFIIIICVLVLHWVLPKRCHWLENDQLDNLKNILVVVFASNTVTTWLNKTR